MCARFSSFSLSLSVANVFVSEWYVCVSVFFVCRVSHWEVFSSWCWWWWCVPAYGIVSAAVSLSSSSLLIRSNKQSGQHTAMKNKRFFSPSTKIAPALKLSRTNNTWITAASHHRPYEYILYLYRGRTQQVRVVFFLFSFELFFFLLLFCASLSVVCRYPSPHMYVLWDLCYLLVKYCPQLLLERKARRTKHIIKQLG